MKVLIKPSKPILLQGYMYAIRSDVELDLDGRSIYRCLVNGAKVYALDGSNKINLTVANYNKVLADIANRKKVEEIKPPKKKNPPKEEPPKKIEEKVEPPIIEPEIIKEEIVMTPPVFEVPEDILLPNVPDEYLTPNNETIEVKEEEPAAAELSISEILSAYEEKINIEESEQAEEDIESEEQSTEDNNTSYYPAKKPRKKRR